MPTNHIRDLIYFDFDKAMSIWSQFEGGKIEQYTTTTEDVDGVDGGVSAGIPNVLSVKLGAHYEGRNLYEESKVVHHDLLSKVEERLKQVGLLSDLASLGLTGSGDVEAIQSHIGQCPYIKAEGKSVIEDYRRFSTVSQQFNDIVQFISRSAVESVKESEAYLSAKDEIDKAKSSLKSISDRNERAREGQRIKALESELEKTAESGLGGVDQWILDGTQLWIKTFMPTRINFRIYPFDSAPSFQILCNLKRECFVDEDLQHLLYGYGQRPNVELTVTGLITSIPPKDGYNFDPLAEFKELSDAAGSDDSDSENHKALELAFRNVFAAFEGMEDFVRYSRYPNVTVHPIAV